jgi:hypothetical protein
MKWTRAVHHLETLAQSCTDLGSRPAFSSLRVEQLWVAGEVLDEPQDVETVTVALVVDLPVDEVPWRSEPPGSQHWANGARLGQSPVLALWRSAAAPVWNHRIERPALLWDSTDGLVPETLAALQSGRGDTVRLPPPAPAVLRGRLQDELAVSDRALRACTQTYERRRWAPGAQEPHADALWRACAGYLDVRDALAALDRLDGTDGG